MKTNTQNSTVANANNATSKLKVAAVVLMAAGWGWIGGNFTPIGASIWNYLLHCISIVLLLLMSVQMFRLAGSGQQTEARTGWVNIAMSIFAVVSISGCIVLITLGIVNPDPNSVGVHNFADWFPTIILNMGTFLWLATMIPAPRRHTDANVASSN
ncbi:MAG: hypothetical protein ACR2H5_15560 [Ktedonobacteraceae bacterium]